MRRTAIAILISAAAAGAAEWYVSPDGQDRNTGAKDSPWCFGCLSGKSFYVKPGDTVWLKGGVYSGTFSVSLRGTAENPIILRAAPRERATLECPPSATECVEVTGQHTWLWGVEIRMTPVNRRWPAGMGVAIQQVRGAGVGFRLINSIIHDTGQGVGLWEPAEDSEIYGTLIYFNGNDGSDRGHGHGIYVQNRNGTKKIADNIVWGNYSHGLHAYTENGFIDHIVMEGNIAFENGSISAKGRARNLLYGGAKQGGAQNCVVVNNFTYYTEQGGGNDVGYRKGCTAVTVSGNRFISPGGTALSLDNELNEMTVENNVFWGGTTQRNPENTADAPFGESEYPNNTFLQSRPSQSEVFVRPNRYEPGRANIVVYNWESRDTVSVDLSALLAEGAPFEIRDAQNFFGPPVVSGVYPGGAIELPMTLTDVSAITGVAPVVAQHTPAEFGAFILLPSEGGVFTAAAKIDKVKKTAQPFFNTPARRIR